MRYPTLTLLGLALLGAAACGNSGNSNSDSSSTVDMAPAGPPLNEELVGTWKSETCENAGTLMGTTIYIKRTYTFTSPTEFTISADIYGDGACSFLKLLNVDEKGTFTIGNSVSTVQGAKEAEFAVSQRGVTAYIQQAVSILNSVSCGGSTSWAVGVRQDISAAGCDPVEPSTSSCPTEHDLAELSSSSELKLGARPSSTSSVCTARPTAAGPALMKQ